MHQHETLGVGDDLGSVKSLLEVLKELLLVTLKLALSANKLKLAGSLGTLVLDRRETTGKNGLGDQSNWHTEIKSVDGGPLSGTLLSSRIHDLLEKWGSIIIVEVHDITGNFNQEGIENALVPFCEDITNLLVWHTETALHDIVGLEMLAQLIGGIGVHTSQISCMSPYSIPLCTILT